MDPFIFMPEPEKAIHLIRYKRFIWSRLFREFPKGVPVEKHHIVPVSFGMQRNYSRQPWNIIRLTPREHFLAHLMLYKAFGNEMTYAFWMLAHFKQRNKSQRLSSKQYELLRIEHCKLISASMKGRYIGRKLSNETKQKISKALAGRVTYVRVAPMSQDQRRALSKALLGKPLNKARIEKREKTKRENRAKGMYSYVPSQETKEKNRKAHLGKQCSEETKEKLKMAITGKKRSLTTRARLKAAAKERIVSYVIENINTGELYINLCSLADFCILYGGSNSNLLATFSGRRKSCNGLRLRKCLGDPQEVINEGHSLFEGKPCKLIT